MTRVVNTPVEQKKHVKATREVALMGVQGNLIEGVITSSTTTHPVDVSSYQYLTLSRLVDTIKTGKVAGVEISRVSNFKNYPQPRGETHVIRPVNTDGGNYKLTYYDKTTGNIAWNTSAATLKSALEALAVGGKTVYVSRPTGGEIPAPQNSVIEIFQDVSLRTSAFSVDKDSIIPGDDFSDALQVSLTLSKAGDPNSSLSISLAWGEVEDTPREDLTILDTVSVLKGSVTSSPAVVVIKFSTPPDQKDLLSSDNLFLIIEMADPTKGEETNHCFKVLTDVSGEFVDNLWTLPGVEDPAVEEPVEDHRLVFTVLGPAWADLPIEVTADDPSTPREYHLKFSPYHGPVVLPTATVAGLTQTAAKIKVIPQQFNSASGLWTEITDPGGDPYFAEVSSADSAPVAVNIPLDTVGLFRLSCQLSGAAPEVSLAVQGIFKSTAPPQVALTLTGDVIVDKVIIRDASDPAEKLTVEDGAALVTETSSADILAKLEDLETKLNGVIDIQVTGSIHEYGWLSTETAPTPIDPAKFAMGVEINATTHEMAVKYWDGTAWQEVQ